MRLRTVLCAPVLAGVAAVAMAAPAGARVAAPDVSTGALSCTWRSIPIPQIGGKDVFIADLAATGPDDAWAVGRSPTDAPIIEHWDGSAWTLVQDGSAFKAGTLTAVVAVSPDLAYAFGWYRTGTHNILAEQYQNGVWTTMTAPRATEFGTVFASLDNTGNPWIMDEGSNFFDRWTGSRWKSMPTPSGGYVYDLTVLSPKNVWASTEPTALSDSLWQFNGSGWTDTGDPLATSQLGIGLAGLPPNSMWAVGNGSGDDALAGRYRQGAWSTVPVTQTLGGRLFGVGAYGSEVWAVGTQGAGAPGTAHPLIEGFNGKQFVIKPSNLTGKGDLTQVTVAPGAAFATGVKQTAECT